MHKHSSWSPPTPVEALLIVGLQERQPTLASASTASTNQPGPAQNAWELDAWKQLHTAHHEAAPSMLAVVPQPPEGTNGERGTDPSSALREAGHDPFDSQTRSSNDLASTKALMHKTSAAAKEQHKDAQSQRTWSNVAPGMHSMQNDTLDAISSQVKVEEAFHEPCKVPPPPLYQNREHRRGNCWNTCSSWTATSCLGLTTEILEVLHSTSVTV